MLANILSNVNWRLLRPRSVVVGRHASRVQWRQALHIFSPNFTYEERTLAAAK